MGCLVMLVSACDPGLKNTGLVRLKLINVSGPKFEVQTMRLVQTEKQTTKSVRQNSDDLRRMQETHKAFLEVVTGTRLLFAEVPTGAQSARAMFAFGSATMLIATSPAPIIQVQPFETKLATVGTKTASKEEMIEWATEVYPDAPWIRHAGKVTLKNEHLADALAIAHAGIKTDQFKQLVSMMHGMGVAA